MNTLLMKLNEPLQAPENLEFWQGTAKGALLLKHCTDCEKLHWYPRALCPWCLSNNTEWHQVSGKGKIYSFTTTGDSTGEYPAYISLEEGPVMLSVVKCDEGTDVAIGLAVSVAFSVTATGTAIPFFKPDKQQASDSI